MRHNVWALIALLALGTAALKAIGPVGIADRRLPARMTRVVVLLAPALLAGLLVTETFTTSHPHQLTIDARAAGLLAAGVAMLLRFPLVLVLIVAATATAVIRIA